MTRKPLLIAISALLFFVFTADAFADAKCKTRNKCRWWAKKYVATATVGCWFPAATYTLCYKRAASCGAASASCGWKSCLWGGATASATNNYGSCYVTAARSGLGRYGEETVPEPGSENGEGSHDGVIRTEYLDEGGAAIHFDDMRLSSTLDESFSRIDVVAYVESEESLENDSESFPPERVLYRSYIHLQNGKVTHKGFDGIADQLRDADGSITEIDLSGFSQYIPAFEGTADELDRVAIDVIVDGGQPPVSSEQ